jgi:hypothetical protein
MFLGTFPERILLNWGKQRAQLGQARYPTWASTVPISCTFLFSLPMMLVALPFPLLISMLDNL